MELQEFQPYCLNLLNRPQSEDSSELSKHTRIVGVAIACQCTMSAASSLMKQSNASTFNRSLGASTKETLLSLNNGITAEDVTHYLQLPVPEGVVNIINNEKPDSGDLFSVFLAEAVKKAGTSVRWRLGIRCPSCPPANRDI
jgi:hypothetical protein